MTSNQTTPAERVRLDARNQMIRVLGFAFGPDDDTQPTPRIDETQELPATAAAIDAESEAEMRRGIAALAAWPNDAESEAQS